MTAVGGLYGVPRAVSLSPCLLHSLHIYVLQGYGSRPACYTHPYHNRLPFKSELDSRFSGALSRLVACVGKKALMHAYKNSHRSKAGWQPLTVVCSWSLSS